jgi:hypothetical protein
MQVPATLEAVSLNSGVTVTLNFPDYHEAARALARLAGIGIATIPYEDRPDVGAPPAAQVFAAPAAAPAVPPTPPAAQVFAAPAAPVAPATVGAAVAPAAPPVPSSAAVVPPPSAPVAPPVGSIPQPPAAAPSAPSPAPAAPAPSAPVGLTTLANGVVVDNLGTPWDGRIHSETKTTNKDGTWRQKRGLNDEAMKKRIESEIRASVAAILPPGFLAQQPPAAPPAMPTPPAAPVAAAPAPAPVAPPAAPTPQIETFSTVASRMATYVAAGKVNAEQIAAELAQLLGPGAAFAGLASRPDLVPYFGGRLDTLANTPAPVAA